MAATAAIVHALKKGRGSSPSGGSSPAAAARLKRNLSFKFRRKDPGDEDTNQELDRQANSSGIWKYQPQVQAFYKHTYTEVFVALLIMGNFATNMVEKTFDPGGRKYKATFAVFELFYNISFTVELAINMYAFWLWPFWRSGWNLFDFVVVSIGLLDTLKAPLPGPLKLLRMMRAFRVFRLFKRVKSLRKILASLARAIPGVANAFVILFLFTCIYAILGVEFFGTYGTTLPTDPSRAGYASDESPQPGFYNENGEWIESVTDMGLTFGWEYFGNFPKALYTMFQVMTAESWSEQIARPVLHAEDTGKALVTALYFVSFMVINAIILINVVIAVLLEKMTMNDEDESSKPGPGDNDVHAVGEEFGPEPSGDSRVSVTERAETELQMNLVSVENDVEDLHQQLALVLAALQRGGGGGPDLHTIAIPASRGPSIMTLPRPSELR